MWFQKISIPPPRRELEIPRGGGGVRGSGNSRGEGGSGFTNTPKLLDDSTEVMEGVTLTPEILGNKQGAA